MPISSYVLLPQPNQMNLMLDELMELDNVEIQVSEDQQAAVLVSETVSVKAEESFQEKLGLIQGLQAFTYVFGHEIPEEV